MTPPASDPDDDRTVIRPLAPGAAPDAGRAPAAFAPTELQTQREQAAPASAKTEIQAHAPAPAAAPAPTAEHGNALPVGLYLAEFEITRVLGEGGFGIVYLAQDHSLQRRVALKEYMPSALAARTSSTHVAVKSERHRETFELGLKSFVNEARLLAQFDHPALVKVYRFWEDNGTAYMVMPFYEGITLKDKLREMSGPPDEAWLKALLAPLTEALMVIHAEHCYHRDIAPDNIMMLAGSGRPLLLDFGAARRVIGDMTQALTVILKPGYAPLEQYAEVPGMKQGPWTDVYALAAVVYYAITRKTPPAAVGRMMNDTYVPLAQLAAGRYHDRFLQAIDRALRVKPEERTQSIQAFRDDLGLTDDDMRPQRTAFPSTEALPTREPVITPMAATPKAAAPAPASGAQPTPAAAAASRSKGPLIAAAGAVAVLGLAGAAYWTLTPHGAAPGPGQASAPAPAPTSASSTADVKAEPPAPAPAVTTAAAPAPPPSVVAAPPTDEFERIAQAASPDFQVQAQPLRDRLRIDKDPIGFTVSSARDGYVYVIARDPDGSTALMFPNTQARDNHIRAGQTLTLPHKSWALLPTEPAGEERFLVVVSAEPRDVSKLGQAASWFRKLSAGDAAAALLPGNPGTKGDFGAARFSIEYLR
jgi:serine/threonine protein kinase